EPRSAHCAEDAAASAAALGAAAALETWPPAWADPAGVVSIQVFTTSRNTSRAAFMSLLGVGVGITLGGAVKVPVAGRGTSMSPGAAARRASRKTPERCRAWR